MILHLAALIGAFGLVQTNDFVSRLYSSVASTQIQNNVVISPTAIRASLALLYLGTMGNSGRELGTLLQLHGNSQEKNMKEFKQLPQKIVDSNIELYTVIKLFIDKKFQINPSFQFPAIHYLNTMSEYMDFSKSEQAAEKISTFIETHTASKCEDIVTLDEINKLTKSMLVLGFYFKGKFAKPFDRFCKQQEFFYKKRKSILHDTYYKSETLLHGAVPELDGEGIEIPYKNSNLSLLIIKPKIRTYNLRQMEKSLKEINLLTLSANFKRERVLVQLPRFSIQFKTELMSALIGLGLKDTFENPRFSIVTATPNFEISSIKHKGIIEVNPENNNATCGIPIDSNDASFIVNHPFLFAIKDETRIYFVGRVIKPEYNNYNTNNYNSNEYYLRP